MHTADCECVVLDNKQATGAMRAPWSTNVWAEIRLTKRSAYQTEANHRGILQGTRCRLLFGNGAINGQAGS